MDHEEFRVKAKEMVDFIADYLENVGERRVYPGVQPGFLHNLLPKEAPVDGERWDDIFKDVEDVIMPGLVHWQSPHMHAYFPALTSYPSIMGEMLSSALNVLCFTWASSPAGTELETISMNWLGKILGLPDEFLNEENESTGGGVIQTTASEATLVSLLAARAKALTELAKLNPDMQSAELLGHLVCYCSDQAHSSVEKAGLIGLVKMRYIESDYSQSMRGKKLEEAILSDQAKGLVPFWVCATLGTTGSVAFDNLREIGEVCRKYSSWLHVDAAYAGSAFICPEFRHWLDGIELADSFAFNPSKWMMVNFDCTAMWVRDSTALHRTFNVNPIYLRHENSGRAIDYMVGKQNSNAEIKSIRTKATDADDDVTIKDTNVNGDNGKNSDTDSGIAVNGSETVGFDEEPNTLHDYDAAVDEEHNNLHGYDATAPGCGDVGQMIQLENPDKKELLHWQIPLSRRFRALKLWFVLRNYGVSGIQKHIRESVRLAQKFEALVLADARFEIPQSRNLGLVAFRLKGDNTLTECLLKKLNARGHMHAVPACFKGVYVIRFTVTSPRTTNQDILDDWNEIKVVASEILKDIFGSEHGNIDVPKKPRISLKETRDLNATFGTSLLLANSPMSPKIVNGTHAAICDYEQVLTSCAHTFAQLKMELKDSPEMRRRVRGIKMCGKKFSLDSCMDMVQGLMVEQPELQTLPLCTEDEREDMASNGSSPGDKSLSTSVISTAFANRYEDSNQLLTPPTQPRQSRSKSVDMSSTGLNLEDAKVTVDFDKQEILITPTESKNFRPNASDKTVHFGQLESRNDKIHRGDEFNQAFEEGIQALNAGTHSDAAHCNSDDYSSKLTIKGPGSYIKKIIQQFSEGTLESEKATPRESIEASPSIMERADAICKKCFHIKGKVSK